MYYYWKEKGISPSVFYNMPKGELKLIQAFYEEEMKEKEQKHKAMEKQGFLCPAML